MVPSIFHEFTHLNSINSDILFLMLKKTSASRDARPRTWGDLDQDTKTAVNSFVRHLSQVGLPGISRILLYGSRARGDYQADSDVDIAVVLAGAAPVKRARFNLLMQLSDIRTLAIIDTGIAVSAICLWEDEIRYPKKQNNPAFYHNVVADGILLETQV